MRTGLKRLGYRSYLEYLSSSHWRRTVQKWRKDHCEACGWEGSLALHHVTYARLGHEYKEDLVTVCQRCHKEVHSFARSSGSLQVRRKAVRELPTANLKPRVAEQPAPTKHKRRRPRRPRRKTPEQIARGSEFPLEAVRALRKKK